MEGKDPGALAPDEEVVLEEGADMNGAGDLMGQLRGMHSAIVEQREHDLDIPGYGGRLVARYRRLEYEEVTKIGQRTRRMRDDHNPMATLFGQCDVLATALVNVYLRKDPKNPDELEPLSQGFTFLGEGVVGWDGVAKLVLKDGTEPPKDARAAIRSVFANDLAIPAHQAELAAWMQEARLEDEEDFSLDF